MALARIAMTTLDCADPEPLAEFWSALLGGAVMARNDDVAVVQTDTIWVGTVRVPDYTPPTWPDGPTPKHIHLDLAVRDLDQAEAEALRLGARKADHQPQPDQWRILLDPAGHPFCLTANIPF
ncbi:VOC family protein [Actinophytocola sp.]|uniref:VOC family protein n=1 Tax=Actinophytocola sp. TaxID=1872138 RepID=UPI00389B0B8D